MLIIWLGLGRLLLFQEVLQTLNSDTQKTIHFEVVIG